MCVLHDEGGDGTRSNSLPVFVPDIQEGLLSVCRRIGCVLRMKSRLVFIADVVDTDVEKRCRGRRKDAFTITCGPVKVVGLDGVLQEHQMA